MLCKIKLFIQEYIHGIEKKQVKFLFQTSTGQIQDGK